MVRRNHGSSTRGDNATDIGHTGNEGDHGGHLGAHRFHGDTPDEGIVPQAGNLNLSAWRTMENEWADWTDLGYEVHYGTDVYPPGSIRPDSFEVEYEIVDPRTGSIVYDRSPSFRNEADQPFIRLTRRQMEEAYGQ